MFLAGMAVLLIVAIVGMAVFITHHPAEVDELGSVSDQGLYSIV